MNLNLTPQTSKETWIEVRFKVPLSRQEEAYQTMRKLGFQSVSNPAPAQLPHEEFIPWREEFADYTDAEIIGITVKETRRLANLTQRQLSQLAGIPQRQLSEIEQGKRSVDKSIAKQLAKVLGVNYRTFL